ncbi:hypothetical protein ACF05L_06355 [Streptomyces bobili]|uniref:hypothetical protein n=1 Tax=Streptomyces bobili TaxID=67280 RepID=UPI003702E189
MPGKYQRQLPADVTVISVLRCPEVAVVGFDSGVDGPEPGDPVGVDVVTGRDPAGSAVMVAVHTDEIEVFFRHVVPAQS